MAIGVKRETRGQFMGASLMRDPSKTMKRKGIHFTRSFHGKLLSFHPVSYFVSCGVDPDFRCASVRSAVVRGAGRSQQRLRQVGRASVAMARFFKFGTFDQEVVTTYDSGGLVVLVDRTMRALWSCAGNISSLRS
jgi:hypothetical protein